MPIEHAAIKNLGLNRNELDPLVLRNECKNYALQWIDIQRNDFKRLGVLGDWDHPYVTLVPDYEAVQIHVFGEMAKKGYIYKGQKSVYWCPHCETALAEAEIEYAEQKSPAIYVKMPIVKDNGMMPEAAKGKPAYMVIWTTLRGPCLPTLPLPCILILNMHGLNVKAKFCSLPKNFWNRLAKYARKI